MSEVRDKQKKFISKYLASRFIGEESAEGECDSEAEFILKYMEQIKEILDLVEQVKGWVTEDCTCICCEPAGITPCKNCDALEADIEKLISLIRPSIEQEAAHIRDLKWMGKLIDAGIAIMDDPDQLPENLYTDAFMDEARKQWIKELKTKLAPHYVQTEAGKYIHKGDWFLANECLEALEVE